MRRKWPREGRQPVRDAGGFGPRPARGGGRVLRRIFAYVRANSPAIREARFARRVGIGAPHGANSERINCPVRDAIYATFAR